MTVITPTIKIEREIMSGRQSPPPEEQDPKQGTQAPASGETKEQPTGKQSQSGLEGLESNPHEKTSSKQPGANTAK
ncbi:hypothetical protein YB2330_001346 [Saitoella coloradoensis]